MTAEWVSQNDKLNYMSQAGVFFVHQARYIAHQKKGPESVSRTIPVHNTVWALIDFLYSSFAITWLSISSCFLWSADFPIASSLCALRCLTSADNVLDIQYLNIGCTYYTLINICVLWYVEESEKGVLRMVCTQHSTSSCLTMTVLIKPLTNNATA